MRLFVKLVTVLTLTHFFLLSGASAGPIGGQGTWETTLQARDLDGDGTVDAWFDSTLNITWLENASLSNFDDMGGVSGIHPYGNMNWNTSIAYVGKMISSAYLGQTGWRLPKHVDIGNDGCASGLTNGGGDCSWNPDPGTGEMAHMYQFTLANTTPVDPVTGAMRCSSFLCFPGNSGPFAHMRPFSNYWYGQEDVTDASQAWSIAAVGSQLSQGKGFVHPIWPVLDGDVGVHVVESLTVEATDLPAGIEGAYYTESLAAGGGVLPYKWIVSGGTLPAGLELNGDTGEISGIPSQTTTSQVQFTVIDANQNTSEMNVTMAIHPKVGC
jgi:hypothetical protein